MADKRLQVILDLKDRMSGQLRKPTNALQRLDGTVSALKGALSVGLVVFAGKAAWELGELGARSKDVRRNLEAFAGGAENAAKFMNAIVAASDKSVDRMTASSVASRMLQMGLADTNEEMALYVEGAVRLGDQSLSSSQRIGEMVQFLKNLNINMADNFGLSRQVLTARTKELQASRGLSREEAMLIGIKEELNRQLEILGPRAEDGATSIDQLKTAFQNLKLALAEKAAGPTTKFADRLAEALDFVTGGLQGGQDELKDYYDAQLNAIAAAENLAQAESDLELAEARLASIRSDAPQQHKDRAQAMFEEAQKAYDLARAESELATANAKMVGREEEAVLAGTKMTFAQARMADSMVMVISKEKEAAAAINQTLEPLGAQAIAMYRNAQAGQTMNNAMLSTIGTVRSMTVAFVPDEAVRMWGIMRDEQQRMKDEFIRNAALHGRAEEDAADKTKAAWDSAYADAQAAAAQFDSEVQSLFQSTMNVDVSAKLQGAGFRTDTWDEWKRRAADVMNLGKDSPWFEKLVANFPSFNDLLAKMGDPGAAAAAWIQQFDAGMIPEAVNLDAIVEAYKSKVASEEAWAGIYEQAKAAILAQGGDVDESLLRQLTGGPMATDELDDIAGGFQDIGSDVSGAKAEITKLGKKAGAVFPQIGSEIHEVRKQQRRWNDALADTISLLKQISEMEINWPAPGVTTGGTTTGDTTTGGTTPTPPPGAKSAGFSSIYVGNITVSPDDTFRKALKSVGVPNL